MARSKPWIADRKLALYGGIALTTAGVMLLWDAHEHRGVSRPFWLKFLPSP